ncbi:unnamed protein product [Bursaphelenchus okinawaensis]|uniref:Mos1 transposase HTH domain-containing protein n=1 Tax=Bursaphelenchus okinawaensis TaxID=465554 RepID=A0A811K8U3_9BILA|nr:unnamed protein product [Bursaphelenchus okinawaensis]CAG9095226.1 unnamed protein product [Bursaphelenchus okinawaensis]
MDEEVKLNRDQVRAMLLLKFCEHGNAARATKEICSAIGPSVVSYDTVKVWFLKFKNGDFDMSEKPRSGRPSVLEKTRLLKLIEEDPRRTITELAVELQCDPSTVTRGLHALGKSWKNGQWVRHKLNSDHLNKR